MGRAESLSQLATTSKEGLNVALWRLSTATFASHSSPKPDLAQAAWLAMDSVLVPAVGLFRVPSARFLSRDPI
jgi:hypothetical protein